MLEKFKQTKFYSDWIKLINDLKPMTPKQRVDHLWTYYKYYLVVVFLVVMTGSVMITVAVNRSREMLVSGMMVNLSMEQQAVNYLTEDYLADLGGTKGKQVVELTSTEFGDPLDPSHGEDSYFISQVLISRVSGKMLDYMLLDRFAMEYYILTDVYMDLRNFFTPQELEELNSKKLVIYAQEEGSERYPIAVKINHLPFVQDNLTEETEVFFAISGSTPRPDMCRNVWNRLQAWEKEE